MEPIELDNITLSTGAVLPRALSYPNNLLTFTLRVKSELTNTEVSAYYLLHQPSGVILCSHLRDGCVDPCALSLSKLSIEALWGISDATLFCQSIPVPLHCYLDFLRNLGPRTEVMSWAEYEISDKYKRKLARTRAPYLAHHNSNVLDLREIVIGEPIKHPSARYPVFYLRNIDGEYQVDHQPSGSRVARVMTRALAKEIIKSLYDYGLPAAYNSDRLTAISLYPGNFGAWLASHRFALDFIPYKEWSAERQV